MNELLTKWFNPTCAWANWPRNLVRQTLNSISQPSKTNTSIEIALLTVDGQCAPNPKKRFTIRTVANFAHILPWQCNDITSIDGSITDVIVYRVHSEYSDRYQSRRNRAIQSYLLVSRDIDATRPHVGICWFRSSCHIPAIHYQCPGNITTVHTTEYNITYFTLHWYKFMPRVLKVDVVFYSRNVILYL